jgi:hypothetical protein
MGGFDWQRMVQEESSSAEALSEWINLQNWPVSSIADVGAGPGHWAQAIATGLNLSRGCVNGYDIASIDFAGFPIHRWDITRLRIPPAWLVLCLEVFEHIDEAHADQLADHLAAAVLVNGRLVFSAARPGQGGIGHINCQRREYWAEKLEARGLRLAIGESASLINFVRSQRSWIGWFPQNLMIFRQPGRIADRARILDKISAQS